MTFDLTTFAIYAVPALLVGLVLGYLLFNGGRARAALREELGEKVAALRAAEENQAKLEQQVAMERDKVKPLADEVDRLKAMKTRAPEAAPAGAAAPTPRAEAPPAKPLPAFLDEKPADPDDLSLLKGVGPKLEAALHDLGVWKFAQIADWDENDLRVVDSKVGAFKGRIQRDQVQEQAKLLAAGRVTEYEARFGKIGPAGK
ncbi:MAG: hypothetical protein V2J26_01270 [Pacificimonas sp.]|jgi:predicted flap endonuclease-1-like 5' DNA nuclease|nr:hypothetical protein [Pacificimonas sp.]